MVQDSTDEAFKRFARSRIRIINQGIRSQQRVANHELFRISSYINVPSRTPQPYYFPIIPVISPVSCHHNFPVYFLSLILYSLPNIKIRNFFLNKNTPKMTPSKAMQVSSLLILVITFPPKNKITEINHIIITTTTLMLTPNIFYYHKKF